MSWDQISANPDFQALPEDRRARVQENYFRDRIAPNVPPERLDAVRSSFFRTAPAPKSITPGPFSCVWSSA